MDFNIHDVGKIFQTNEVSGIKNVSGDEIPNCVFVNGNKKLPQNTFNAEEQYVLGLFANTPVLIED